MKTVSACLLGLGLAAGCALAAADPASPPAPSFGLALTASASASQTVYRGWPIILRGDAYLLEDASASIPLEAASLKLTVAPAHGAASPWPVRLMTALTPTPTLGAGHDVVRVSWLLTAEQSASLMPGTYTATLSWAGQESPPLAITVAEAPANPSPEEAERRAILRSEAALLLGNTTAALDALAVGGAKQPDSINLLVQRARVLQQTGDFTGALDATQQAREAFRRDYPKASEPPVSIIAVQSQVMAAMLKSLPANPAGAPAAAPGQPAHTPPPAATSTRPSPEIENRKSKVENTAAPAPKPVVLPGEPNYASDANGQWAATAEASSQYGTGRYSASQATGAPNASSSGDHWEAWTSKTMDAGAEWLLLHYTTPVHATEVRVRQTYNPGAIVKVEVLDEAGQAVTVWSGHDTTKYDKNQVGWFVAKFAATEKPVSSVRLTLDTASVKGWNAIDAVQLVGTR